MKKTYLRIGEIAKILGVKPSTLRSWERSIPVFKPVVRNGRKFYSEKDLLNFKRLKRLILDEKYTIEGAKERLLSGRYLIFDREALDFFKKEVFEIIDILSD